MPLSATPTAAAAQLHINRQPDTNRVNPTEAREFRAAYHAGYQPGCCPNTLMSSIVSIGALAGIDYRQERAALTPELLQFTPAMAVAR